MGLDMYLFERKTGIELMYWRKANQIRQWFVDHLEDFDVSDNCGKYDVSRDTLQELVNDIDYILEAPTMEESSQRAEERLPTSSGFFFGGVQYDEYYFDELERTREFIQEIIDTTNEEDEIYYTEWW